MATTEKVERFDISDLPVDVFDLVAGEMAAESLTGGHGATEYDASRTYVTCNCAASCAPACSNPSCSSCGSAACDQVQ